MNCMIIIDSHLRCVHNSYPNHIVGSQASALSAMLVKMVRYGLNVDTRNHLGYTALLLACKAGSYQNALELIRKGQACPYLRDHEFRFSAKDWLLR